MTRKLSEKRAWLYLARCFEHAAMQSLHRTVIHPGSWGALGVCFAVTTLFVRDYISPRTLDRMRAKIRSHRPMRRYSFGDARNVYYWPITAEGHRQRAAFCRARAKACRGSR